MKKNMIGAFLFLLVLNSSNAQDPDLYFRDQQLKKQEDQRVIADWPLDSITKQIRFSEVINVENASAQDLYSRGKLFVAYAYKSSKSVTQLNDDAAKILLIKPVIRVQEKDFWTNETRYVSYQLRIECKDNRYRYTIEGHALIIFGNDGTSTSYPFTEKKLWGYSKKTWLDIQNQAISQTNLIISVLKSMMGKPISDF